MTVDVEFLSHFQMKEYGKLPGLCPLARHSPFFLLTPDFLGLRKRRFCKGSSALPTRSSPYTDQAAARN